MISERVAKQAPCVSNFSMSKFFGGGRIDEHWSRKEFGEKGVNFRKLCRGEESKSLRNSNRIWLLWFSASQKILANSSIFRQNFVMVISGRVKIDLIAYVRTYVYSISTLLIYEEAVANVLNSVSGVCYNDITSLTTSDRCRSRFYFNLLTLTVAGHSLIESKSTDRFLAEAKIISNSSFPSIHFDNFHKDHESPWIHASDCIL